MSWLCFRDCHEIAFHSGVGDSNRATLRYLFSKKWNHAAAEPNHIAEAHCNKPGFRMRIQILTEDLATRLLAP